MDCREHTGHFTYATLHSILNVIAGPVLAANLHTLPSGFENALSGQFNPLIQFFRAKLSSLDQ